MERWKSSNPGKHQRTCIHVTSGAEQHTHFKDEVVWVFMFNTTDPVVRTKYQMLWHIRLVSDKPIGQPSVIIKTTPKFASNDIWFPVVSTVIRPPFCLDHESDWIRQHLCLSWTTTESALIKPQQKPDHNIMSSLQLYYTITYHFSEVHDIPADKMFL